MNANPITLAAVALLRRPKRNLAAILAVLFSTLSLVALQGITGGMAAQTASRFERMGSSTVTVNLPGAFWDKEENDILDSLQGLEHVRQAGTLVIPDDAGNAVTIASPRWDTTVTAGIAIATWAGLAARSATLLAGTPSDDGIRARDDGFEALLGTALARELGITMHQHEPHVLIDGTPMRIAGIVEDAESEAVLSTMLIVTPRLAGHLGILPPSRTIMVRADDGYASSIAQVLPLAMHPAEPHTVTATPPPDPAQLRQSLMGDTENMTMVVTALMMAVTAFAVINTMQSAVSERRREIGISLALGQPRRSVALQFLTEATLMSGLGTVLGMCMGSLASLICSLWSGWPFILPIDMLLVLPLGLGLGAISGLLPAFAASRIDPAELLRST